ncbi:MAG TPA: sugar transferase [Gaiellaceae bacterium]|nr:sugar transferase [Gaiellaceae bacterium]
MTNPDYIHSLSSISSVRAEHAFEQKQPSRLYRGAKRTFDLAVGLLALMLATPFLICAAVAIAATSSGPVFFRQERIGYRGRTFRIWKLRTMYANTDDSEHRAYVRAMFTEDRPLEGGRNGLHKLDDHRVTPVGRLLRRASIDELPQLFNVLRGEMSLVGPRPALAWEVELFGPSEDLRCQVKPGITGLWQVSGRSRLTMREALDLDCTYAQKPSLLLDLKILLKTIPVVFARRDAA